MSLSLTTVSQQEERPIRQILYLGNLLETCHFQSFWVRCTLTRSHPHGLTSAHPHMLVHNSKMYLILKYVCRMSLMSIFVLFFFEVFNEFPQH